MPDKLYTTNQLAKLFGVVPTTVIDWIERGKLEAFKTLGGHRRITHPAVLRFLSSNRLPPPPAFDGETADPPPLAGGEPAIAVISEDATLVAAIDEALTREASGVRLLPQHDPAGALLAIGMKRPSVVVVDHALGLSAASVTRLLKRELGPSGLRIVSLSDGLPGAVFPDSDAVVPRVAPEAVAGVCRGFLPGASAATETRPRGSSEEGDAASLPNARETG